MNLSLKLSSYREYKNLKPEDLAVVLSIPIESYIDIEKGRSKINGILAQRLSDFYQAPIELFLVDDISHNLQAEVIYTNCTITSGNGGASGYINHQYSDRGIDEIIRSKNEEISLLKIQVEQLAQQNEKLIEMLDCSRKK